MIEEIKREPNLQDSMTMALLINSMKPFLVEIDVDYLQLAIAELCNKASMYDSTAALNRSYSTSRSKLMHAQERALKRLLEYIESLKEIEVIKESVVREDVAQDNIEQMFL